jgi:hypothetical protein
MRITQKIVFCLIFLLSTYGSVFAQTPDLPKIQEGSNFYIKVFAGYGILTPGSYRLVSESISFTAGAPTNVTVTKGLGAGLKYGGGLGFILNDFLNLGVDAEYIPTTTISSSNIGSSSTESINDQSSVTYSSLAIIPNIVFKALSKPDYLIYTKLGIVITLPSTFKQHYNDTLYYASGSDAYGYREIADRNYNLNLNIGVNVALGVQVRLTSKLRAFGEIFSNYTALSPKTSMEVENYKDNQIMPTASKTGFVTFYNINYIKSGTIPPATSVSTPGYPINTPDGYNQTSNTYTETSVVTNNIFHMNAVGINIGIAYRF